MSASARFSPVPSPVSSWITMNLDQLLGLFGPLTLAEPDPRAAAVLVDEFGIAPEATRGHFA